MLLETRLQRLANRLLAKPAGEDEVAAGDVGSRAVEPGSSAIPFSWLIGSLLVPPTFTARSSAT